MMTIEERNGNWSFLFGTFGWFANRRKRWAFTASMVLYGLRACGELQAQENEELELSRT
jgi:hypothetical protein